MNILDAYLSVKKFNTIAGNLTNITPDKVDKQVSLIYEELVETIDALESKDPKELLDGAVDVFVTLAGLLQQLDEAGFEVGDALERVCHNNLSKFPSASEPIVVAGEYKLEKNEEYNVWVLKNENGKIMKPPCYEKVSLDGLYNEEFFEGY